MLQILKAIMGLLIAIIISVGAYYVIKDITKSVNKGDCTAPNKWNDASDRCEPQCDGTASNYDSTSNICVCNTGYTLNSDQVHCDPIPGQACPGNPDVMLRCPTTSTDPSSCYDKDQAECINNVICANGSIIQKHTIISKATIGTDNFTFVTSDTTPLLVSGDTVTVSPALNINKVPTTDDTAFTLKMISGTSNSQWNLYSPTAPSTAQYITFDAPEDPRTQYTFSKVISASCCPAGKRYVSTANPPACVATCPSGVDTKGSSTDCCSTDEPHWGANGICCSQEHVWLGGNIKYCCEDDLCGTSCCGLLTCDTASKKCVNNCGGVNCDIAGGHPCVHWTDTTTGAAMQGCSTVATNFWEPGDTYDPLVQQSHTGDLSYPIYYSDHIGTQVFCATSPEERSQIWRTHTYTADPNQRSSVTAADCAYKVGEENVISVSWNQDTGVCTGIMSADANFPICTASANSNCPVIPTDAEPGLCCKYDTSSGAPVGTLIPSGGVRGIDTPGCVPCSGRGTYDSASQKCVCTIPTGWAKSPYTGDFCQFIDAKCTDWKGPGSESPSGMCPKTATVDNLAGLTPSPDSSAKTAFVTIASTPADCPPNGQQYAAAPGNLGNLYVDNLYTDNNEYDWHFSPVANAIHCQADVANIICKQDQTGDPTKDNPPNCSAAWTADIGTISGNITNCQAPQANPACQNITGDYNGVKGCQGVSSFIGWDIVNGDGFMVGGNPFQQNDGYTLYDFDHSETDNKFCNDQVFAGFGNHGWDSTQVSPDITAQCPGKVTPVWNGHKSGHNINQVGWIC